MATQADVSRPVLPQCLSGEGTGAPRRLRFWAILGGQALSLVGSSLTQFVLLRWITDATGSMAALSSAGMAAPFCRRPCWAPWAARWPIAMAAAG